MPETRSHVTSNYLVDKRIKDRLSSILSEETKEKTKCHLTSTDKKKLRNVFNPAKEEIGYIRPDIAIVLKQGLFSDLGLFD